MRFGHCDICDRHAPLHFAHVTGIETYYCVAHEYDAPAWAKRVKYRKVRDFLQGAPCHTCGKFTFYTKLDAKDDGTGNFTILECKKCYGPDWSPL